MKKNDMFGMIMAVMVVILVLGALPALVTVMTDNNDVQIGRPSDVEEASYIIYKDGDYTCAKNGTTGRIEIRSENATTTIQNAIDAGPGSIYISAGEYVIDYPIVPHSDIEISGGAGTVLTTSKATALIIGNDPYFTGVGYNLSAPYDVTQDVSAGATKIYLDSTTGLNVDDYIIINSTRQFLQSIGDIGEMHKIAYVASTYIVVEEPIYCDFYDESESVLVEVQCTNNISISGITFDGKTPTSLVTGIRQSFVVGLSVVQCSFINTGLAGIDLASDINAVVTECDFKDSRGSGYGYGVVFSNHAQNARVTDCRFNDVTHGFTSGGNYKSVPYGCQITNCVFNNATVREHPTGIGISYSGCSFINSPLRKETPGGVVLNNRFALSSVTIGQTSTSQGASDASNTILTGNNIETGTVTIYNSKNVSVTSNIINSLNSAVLVPTSLLAVTDLTISGNYISSKYKGVELRNTDIKYVLISNNKINAVDVGIDVLAGSYITIRDNKINSSSSVTAVEVLSNNTLIDGNRITSNAYSRVITVHKDNVVITNNIIMGANTRQAITVFGTSGDLTTGVIIKYNTFLNYVDYYAIQVVYTDRCRISDNNYGSDVQGWVQITTSNRTVINGVGINGAYDPASAGDWFGYGYEGLFVKWNNGATHYLSVYRSAAWYDWVVA